MSLALRPWRPAAWAIAAALIAVASSAPAARAAVRDLSVGGFAVQHQFTVPGDSLAVYDAMTGDVSGWWDHTFSRNPKRFVIEAKPGGAFLEIFDESGDGVLHGTVIYAKRGKLLRFRGPLGLSGNAIDMVVSWSYQGKGDSTVVTSDVRVAGQLEKGWPEVVDSVWNHFLIERFKPFAEALARDRRAPGR
jgi:hypothetical protein